MVEVKVISQVKIWSKIKVVFKIQTKVNEEVKRLLVASVGEDIEAKVEFLTQDKARLAADVLEYNNR